jgi:hypothetical protein
VTCILCIKAIAKHLVVQVLYSENSNASQHLYS